MGKFSVQQRLHQQNEDEVVSRFFCRTCSVGIVRIRQEFDLKCVVVLLLTLSVFVCALFWALPLRSVKTEFDAKDSIKLGATVQACFKLQKPVSLLIPHIRRLEYDISGEIGVPYTKVVALSMHQAGASNWTDVVFGVLSDPINVPINPVSLSVLRSSLIELFLQQSNLTLTTSIFGQSSMFELLKFQGGITDKLAQLKEQLKVGLHLRPYENVYLQITNVIGSTVDPPVTVQASIMSDFGILLPQRLKQLAQTITGSPSKNLGLDNSVFGTVKGVSLSSYLADTLHATPPTPSPAPSPEPHDYAGPSPSPYANLSPSYPPVLSPDTHHASPCSNCNAFPPSAPSPDEGPSHSFPPISMSPLPSAVSPRASSPYPPPLVPRTQLSPNLSPSPTVSSDTSQDQDKGTGKHIVSPPSLYSASSSSFAGSSNKIWLFVFSGLVVSHYLLWLHI
ncbi:uncharacterized protein LOC100248076 isoform X3 [Vitis vinifera]|uniref:uncharacterized protein LOC100248076 isoform X3 n=1 Tax=Vitis vinifera TaxID=29760 RepID=UPI00053F35AA|nr:uncharacterized protein LOC100248076 isoform X3 [Vitis vinifera]|eukprot:XP_010657766.1 PREDICTED: protein piccolo isoform X3 [Vitis vinifera]